MSQTSFCKTFIASVSFWAALAAGLLAIPACAQSVAGKWTADWRVLDSGEKDMIYLDLHQEGARITGTMATIGHVYQLQGILSGSHFDLFASARDTKPRLSGDVAGNELHLTTQNDMHPIARPSKPGDEYAPFPHISLPPLHDVPYNGLAKTPPMGWNSWNLFQSNIDDKTVREAADAMVSSGMRDAGYTYVNIDDTWEGVRDGSGNLGSTRSSPT